MYGFPDRRGSDISLRVNAQEAIGADRGRPRTAVFWSRGGSFNHANFTSEDRKTCSLRLYEHSFKEGGDLSIHRKDCVFLCNTGIMYF